MMIIRRRSLLSGGGSKNFCIQDRLDEAENVLKASMKQSY
jgi:hypothetical protein